MCSWLQLWCSFDDLTSGVNVLVVKLTENGGICHYGFLCHRPFSMNGFGLVHTHS